MKNKPRKVEEDLELHPHDWRLNMSMLCSNFLKTEKSIMKGGSLRLRKLITGKSQKSLKLMKFTSPTSP